MRALDVATSSAYSTLDEYSSGLDKDKSWTPNGMPQMTDTAFPANLRAIQRLLLHHVIHSLSPNYSLYSFTNHTNHA